MKNCSSCPRCQGRVFYFIQKAGIPDHRYSSSDTFRDITLTGIDTGNAVGLEAWVCRACGYTEFYARNLPLLEKLAQGNNKVVIVDRSTDATPGL